jgi:hypothetical protein
MALEVFGCRLVTADLEGAKLLPLPDWTCRVSMNGWGMRKVGLRTVEVGGADEGDVNTEVSVMSRAIQTEIDAKGNRRPGGVFGAAVEADLEGINTVAHLECFDDRQRTLLACFCFNFSKIFCDWVLVASAAMLTW